MRANALTGTLLLLLGCPAEPLAPDAEPEAPSTPPPALTEILLPVLSLDGPFRWDVEFQGLATTALELGLSDIPGVLVRVQTDAPPPTWALQRPAAEQLWQATFTGAGTPEALTLTLELCKQRGACVSRSATGPREHPYPMFSELLEGAAEDLGRPVGESVLAAWKKPGSKDTYAELITGRGCATYLGLMPPPVEPESKKLNPVLRAVFIDPGQPIAQWMWARWQVYAVPGGGTAADTLRRASLARPSSPLITADLATTLMLTGKPEESVLVWQGLNDAAPTDPRWMTPLADALLRIGRPLEARTALERLPPSFQADPVHAELQVRIAESMGKDDLDPLLAHWQATNTTSPEPVRRRIQHRVAEGKYADALTLIGALRSRAPGPQTDDLEVALLTATGQIDAAADRAPEGVSARLRARAAREADPAAEPTGLTDAIAALATADARLWSNKPGISLDAADVALRLSPSADAWAARARALEAAGRAEESVQAWQEAWQLDPATDGGPVQPHRIASTFRMEAPAPLALDGEESMNEPSSPNMGMEE